MSEYNAETAIPENLKALCQCLDRRQSAYIEELGGWQQQLDMIYHDIDAWRAAIKAIKDQHPKPTQGA